MIRWLLDLLFPPRCILCHKILDSSKEPICDKCGKFVLSQRSSIRSGRKYTRCVAPFRYKGVVRDSIHRFKFSGCKFYAKTYAIWLAAAITQEFCDYDLVTWVPVSRKRRRKRGYDQGEILCRETAVYLGLEPVACLRKCRDNPAQSTMSGIEKRKANVAGVYAAVNAEAFTGKRILLIDDVTTTGATLEECSRVLHNSGAAAVMCAALAVTE